MTLARIQDEISSNLGRIQDQAHFLENLEIILENCDDMIVITDATDQVIFSNRAAKEELGIMPERDVRHALAEGLLAGPDYEKCAELFETWDECDETMSISLIDGNEITVRARTKIMRPESESHRTKVIILRDCTEHQKLERQLYRSEKLASLGQLISGVAHELNNPLAAILGFAELCRDAKDKTEISRNLEVIDREARRTAHIVENLLSFSRQRHAQRTPVDIHELLERCFALMSYNFRMHNMVVRRDYDATLPAIELDEYQVQQVFMNIILNAVQAMEGMNHEEPRLSVHTSLADDEKMVCIRIEDNGPGIPQQDLARIFTPFFTTKKADEGTGLGLPVSLNIVKQHNGQIRADSIEGQGATFSITLPVSKVLGRQRKKRRTTILRKPLTGRVLAVDDEKSVVEMTKRVLEQAGLQADTAGSIQEAIYRLTDCEYDLVLADMHMPDGSGMEVWEFVQEKQPQLVDKVIFISGDIRVKQKIQERLGLEPLVLLKPFHVADLHKMVNQVLGEKAAAVKKQG
jgi:two-component system NtrC family sensor kinase